MTVRLLLIAMLLIPMIARAQSAPPAIEIADAWARASVGSTGAVYLTIRNRGTVDDRLDTVTTPVAGQVQPHIDVDDGKVTRMMPLNAIDAKANSDEVLKPGGIHLMLTGLHEPLKAGTTIPVTLSFAHAGKIDLTVTVEKAGAMGPAPQGSGNP